MSFVNYSTDSKTKTKEQSFDFSCSENFTFDTDNSNYNIDRSTSTQFSDTSPNKSKESDLNDLDQKKLEWLGDYYEQIAPFKNYSKFNFQCNIFNDEILYRKERNIFLLTNHSDINTHMRAMLLHWIIEVCSQFGFKRDTYFLTVNIIDRFLTCTDNLPTNKLQLLGVTALMIATKFEVIKIYNYIINYLILF